MKAPRGKRKFSGNRIVGKIFRSSENQSHGMEEVIGSIPIRSTNKSNDLAEIVKSARYAFDTLVLMLHSPQHLLHSLSGPEEHLPPGFAPPVWRPSGPSCRYSSSW